MVRKRNFHGLSDSGHFYRERDEWMRYVAGLTDHDISLRLVACRIALWTNPKSVEAWPQQSRIARELGVSERTVRRAVEMLVGEGLIEVNRRRPEGSKRAVNFYRLIHPADSDRPPESSDLEDSHGRYKNIKGK